MACPFRPLESGWIIYRTTECPRMRWLGLVIHSWGSSMWKTEAGGLPRAEDSLNYIVSPRTAWAIE